METILYQKLLFRTAMCVMTCDGEIHKSEIAEMEVSFKNTDFFRDLIFEDEISEFLEEFKKDGQSYSFNLVKQLSAASLNPVQELQIMELALRITYADNRIDENEIKFLNILKSKLNIHDEVLRNRFGEVLFLNISDAITPRVDGAKESVEGMATIGLEELYVRVKGK